jgi:hypothetical protein
MSCSSKISDINITCKEVNPIKSIYVIQLKDCVFKDNEFIRMKRSYGKYKRPIIKLK